MCTINLRLKKVGVGEWEEHYSKAYKLQKVKYRLKSLSFPTWPVYVTQKVEKTWNLGLRQHWLISIQVMLQGEKNVKFDNFPFQSQI